MQQRHRITVPAIWTICPLLSTNGLLCEMDSPKPTFSVFVGLAEQALTTTRNRKMSLSAIRSIFFLMSDDSVECIWWNMRTKVVLVIVVLKRNKCLCREIRQLYRKELLEDFEIELLNFLLVGIIAVRLTENKDFSFFFKSCLAVQWRLMCSLRDSVLLQNFLNQPWF